VDITSNVPEISALQLAIWLNAGEDLQVVDVRPPGLVATGRIDVVSAHRFHNIAGTDLISRRSLAGTGIDPDLPAVVVCSRGHDSRVAAFHLNRLGCRARSLRGGMAAWMGVVLGREVAPRPPSLDRFFQFDRPGKGALGYLLVSDGEALIVDAPRDAGAYLGAARDAGARLVGVADTHVHADYISGGPALARTLEVPYYLHPRDAVYPYDGTVGRVDFRSVEDGDIVRFGRCGLHVLHMPGHTEGSVCYTIDEVVALTGDFIFVGSIGRPDLAGRTEEWTADLWESLELAKRTWRPALTVYPAHYASARERRADGCVAASFGLLLRENDALRFTDRGAFARWVAARTAAFPDAYRRIKAVNVGLLDVDDHAAEELEVGRNQCGLAKSLA
jgi:glyoxylase-like metal-dependent hydrolase (beta-lactamase superfamily II)/rhodanese-related sulfurtransferase